jgi:hypothetical protein
MTRTPLQRPTLLPGLARIWRDPHTLQLGLDPARAVLIELPDPGAARILDLLDGTRPERVVLAHATADGLSADDAVSLIDALHATGFVLAAPSLLPSALPDAARRRLSSEAAALALRQAPGIRGLHPPGRSRGPTEVSAADGPSEPRSRHREAGAPPAEAPPAQTSGAQTPPAQTPPTRMSGAQTPPALKSPTQQQSGAQTSAARMSPAQMSGAQMSGAQMSGAHMTPAHMTPAQILRRRMGARVTISGRGRLAAPVAVALAEAGVGHLDPDVPGAVTTAELPGGPLRAADVGRSRSEAIAQAVLAVAPETDTHSVRRGGASLVVQLGFEQPVALLAASHVGRRQAHLAVMIRDGSVMIGPLVRSTGRPCLNCVELHRRDRDAGWPTPGVTPGNAVEPCAVTTLLAAAAFAAGEVLEFLDGGTPQTLGAAVEISGPGRFRRRTWPPHPGCTCAGRPRRSAEVKHMARHGPDRADPGG